MSFKPVPHNDDLRYPDGKRTIYVGYQHFFFLFTQFFLPFKRGSCNISAMLKLLTANTINLNTAKILFSDKWLIVGCATFLYVHLKKLKAFEDN